MQWRYAYSTYSTYRVLSKIRSKIRSVHRYVVCTRWFILIESLDRLFEFIGPKMFNKHFQANHGLIEKVIIVVPSRFSEKFS